MFFLVSQKYPNFFNYLVQKSFYLQGPGCPVRSRFTKGGVNCFNAFENMNPMESQGTESFKNLYTVAIIWESTNSNEVLYDPII